MRLATATIASLLVLYSHAAPQGGIVPAGTLRKPDECGPKVQGPKDPKDSCDTKPELATNGASSFNISSSFGEHGWDMAGTLFRWQLLCGPVVTKICNDMQLNTTVAGQWYFATSPTGQGPFLQGDTCQVGFWLPNQDPLSTPGKQDPGSSVKRAVASSPDAAPKPSAKQCSTIIGAMVSAADANTEHWSGASINLSENPGDACGRYTLPGGHDTGKPPREWTDVFRHILTSTTGMAVNADYPSYVISADRNNKQPQACPATLTPAGGEPSDGDLAGQ
ncbi:MAG: hypothetical protein Q9168_006673 [Polycauliona sp. 1 TL-2023]